MTVTMSQTNGHGGQRTLTELVELLRVTYTDERAMIWLSSENQALPVPFTAGRFFSPAQLIAAGRIDEVYEVAERIEGQS